MKNNRIRSAPLIKKRAEAEDILNQMANLQNNYNRLLTEYNAEKLAVEERYGPAHDLFASQYQERFNRMEIWAATHPEEFPVEKKTLLMPSGLVGFRTGMPKLALLNRKWTWKKVLQAVTEHLPEFIRMNPEVDRVALIGQREPLKEILPSVGLKVEQDETFFVEPDLTQFETRQTG